MPARFAPSWLVPPKSAPSFGLHIHTALPDAPHAERLADAIVVSDLRNGATGFDHFERSTSWNEKRCSKPGCFLLHLAIPIPAAIAARERRGAMFEQRVGYLMSEIACLPVRVMVLVMDDESPIAAEDRYGGKTVGVHHGEVMRKRIGRRQSRDLANREHGNRKMVGKRENIQSFAWAKIQFCANFLRDLFGRRFESPFHVISTPSKV